ncbi:sulfatase family protein [Nocardioides houyundeii]|uniref:sulfatase family protein n=1 Tax=Nocardioides houyundeii TaxID=2045452 RepID=UPI000C78D993|nr:sulfatase [Nocardioides houyundeii]
MSGRTRAAAALLAGLCLVTAACSGGGNPADVASSAPSPTAVGSGPADPTRPNLLVIETDDMRADELVWMPRTSRLLGAKGLQFLNSFSPNPLCCPARASFLTGKYSHNHRVLSHEPPYGFGAFDDSVTLATQLADAGYSTALIGKYLNGYGVQPTLAGEDSSGYVPPGWTQWWAGLDNKRGRAGGTYDYFHLTANVNGEQVSWPGRYSTDLTAEQTGEVVDAFSQDPDRPWFVWWNPVAPHHGAPIEDDDPGTVKRSDGFGVNWVTPARPDEVRGRFDDEIGKGAGVPASGSPEADVSDKPRYLRLLPELSDTERDVLRTVTRQRAEALSVLDDRIAETFAHLKKIGEADDTVVVFTSDNGYYLGEHRKRQGKINLHEPSIRVPLLIRGPGVPQGTRFDPVTTLDLSATLAAYAGVELPGADGTDLRPLIAQGDRGWSRAVVIQGRMPEAGYEAAADSEPDWDGLGTVGVRLGRWKVVRYATGEREVYDLDRDPLELENLAAGPDTALLARLDQVWEQYVDCAGAGCRQALPEQLRLDPAENERITRQQDLAERETFGGPGRSASGPPTSAP